MTLGCVGVAGLAGFAGLFSYASGSGRVFFVGLTLKLAKNTSWKPVVRLEDPANPANPAHDSVWRDTPPGIGRRSRNQTAGNRWTRTSERRSATCPIQRRRPVNTVDLRGSMAWARPPSTYPRAMSCRPITRPHAPNWSLSKCPTCPVTCRGCTRKSQPTRTPAAAPPCSAPTAGGSIGTAASGTGWHTAPIRGAGATSSCRRCRPRPGRSTSRR